MPVTASGAYRRQHTCSDCGGEYETKTLKLSARCTSCVALRREQAHRLIRLQPLLGRVAGCLSALEMMAQRRVVDRSNWRGDPGESPAALLQEIADLEDQIDRLGDQWTAIVLGAMD